MKWHRNVVTAQPPHSCLVPRPITPSLPSFTYATLRWSERSEWKKSGVSDGWWVSSVLVVTLRSTLLVLLTLTTHAARLFVPHGITSFRPKGRPGTGGERPTWGKEGGWPIPSHMIPLSPTPSADGIDHPTRSPYGHPWNRSEMKVERVGERSEAQGWRSLLWPFPWRSASLLSTRWVMRWAKWDDSRGDLRVTEWSV